MPISDSDPRVFFAAERTLLAGLLHTTTSAALGVGFVMVGTLAIAVAAFQHHRFAARLPLCDLPPRYSRAFALVLSVIVCALGIALAVYLALVQP